MPAGAIVVRHFSLSLCFSDITSRRVHLDVCWIDQSNSLPSGLQQMLLFYPSCVLVNTPTCDVTKTQGKADFPMSFKG
jgi:hypothetical protein